jgi:WD40 repeat protein/tRNA A-37 threonylcarbamoyl transferase component Bud32
MPSTACPTADELRAFHLGDLPEEMLSGMAAHLEECPACEAAAQTLDRVTDPVVAAYRRSARADAPAAPGHVGEYDILGEIGRGGMGVVYKARHRRLGRTVALKMLLRGAYAEPEEKARFRAEAEAVARLQHANIVQLFEVGEHDGGDGQPRPYITLELVDGESLSTRMAGRPQPPRAAAAWVEAVARAVQFAHDRGVVHRDLKPSNVLLAADGQPKLCDFGVAKLLTGSDLKTLSGAVIGTIEYMAPEQAAGAVVGPPADIYALGAILYTALTGRPPFQGTNALVALEQVRSREPVPPRLLVPLVPRDLNTICLKCLEKKPAARYPTAAALADDLRRFLAGEPIVARPVSGWERTWKWSKRRPAVAGLLALSLAVIFVGFPGAMALWLQADRARDQLEGAVYAGHIALADHAYQDTDIAAARSLLDQCRPAPGRPDRRNWEWHYLNCLCHSDLIPGLGHFDKPDTWVFGLAFHPGGRALVSAAGLPSGTLSGHVENAAQVTPGELTVWDPETGRALAKLGGHTGALRAAAFSPDGRWLASGGADGRVRLWDGTTFADRGEVAAVDRPAGNLAFTADGRFLVINSDRAVLVWNLAERRPQFTVADGWAAFDAALAISPDGRCAFSGTTRDGRHVLEIRSASSGATVARPFLASPANAAAFSHDGRLLALAAAGDHRIQVWDAVDVKLLRHLTGHANDIGALAFCSDGRLISGSDDRTVRVWDPATGAEVIQYRGHEMGVQGLAVNPDGRRLASGDKLGTIKLWDLTRDPRGVGFKGVAAAGEYLDQLAFSADGRSVLVVADKDDAGADVHNVARWDAATGQLRERHAIGPRVQGEAWHRTYAFSGDGRRLAGVDWASHRSVAVFDCADGRRLATEETREVKLNTVSLDLSGDRVAFGGWDVVGGEVRAELIVAEVATGGAVTRPAVAANHIIGPAALSPDGRRVACAVRAVTVTGDTVIRAPTAAIHVWSAADNGGTPLILDGAFDGGVMCVTFSPDGRRVAAAGMDGSVRAWDAATGRSVFAPAREGRPPTGLAFSPDGRRLAGAGADGLVHVWDADRGDRLLTLRNLGAPGTGHYGFTARVAFSPDGSRIAANDWDGTVTVWDAGPDFNADRLR